jgi:hypothetical protein
MEGGGRTLTVAPGQLTGSIPFNFTAGTTAANFTLSAPGALNLTSLLTTAGLTYTNASNVVSTGVAGVVTGTSTGTTGVDSITGTAGADTIAGGGGADVLVGGNGANRFEFASGANLALATVTGGTGTDTIAITVTAQTLIDANFTAVHTSVEALTLGAGITATTLGTAANTAGITTVNTGTGATTITATAPVTSLAVVSSVADATALTIGAGSTNYTITNLLGDLTVSNTHTGNAAVTVSAVATVTVALGTDTTGTKAVTATALTDGQILTLTGSDAATVSFANGDLTADAYVGALTVTGTGTTGQFTTGTVSSSISSTGATAVVATAMADDQVLSTSGAGITTITGLIADLTDTSTAAQVITVAAVAAITLALGTDTTGTDAVTANALTNDQVLTLTGSNDVSVALIAGDLIATAYTGVITVNATTGTNLIIGGTDADIINAGAAADTVTGGLGIDVIDLGAADGASDIVVMTTGGAIPVDLISNFLVGAVTPDILQVDRSDLQLQKTIMLAGNGAAAIGATIAAAAGVLTTITAGAWNQNAAATTTAYRISSATQWTAGTLGTALSTGGTYAMTTNGEWAATEAFLIFYDNDVDTFLALVTTAATVATASTGTWVVTNLATLVGVADAAGVLTNNFQLIA